MNSILELERPARAVAPLRSWNELSFSRATGVSRRRNDHGDQPWFSGRSCGLDSYLSATPLFLARGSEHGPVSLLTAQVCRNETTTVECFSLSFPFPARPVGPAGRSSMRVALPSVVRVASRPYRPKCLPAFLSGRRRTQSVNRFATTSSSQNRPAIRTSTIVRGARRVLMRLWLDVASGGQRPSAAPSALETRLATTRPLWLCQNCKVGPGQE